MSRKEIMGIAVAAIAAFVVIFWIVIHKDNNNNFVSDVPSISAKLDDSSNVVTYQEHTLTFVVAAEVVAKMDVDGDAKARTIKMTSETDEETILIRKYLNPPSIMWDPAVQQSFIVDYDRTSSCTDKVKPEAPLTECMGKGLYVWIYGGLYFYDAATGEFTMFMDMSP